MASVRIEEAAFSDLRYERLARLAGLADADHARGKMAKLWRQCTIEQSYTLPADCVVDVLGAGGVDALVASKLGQPAGDGFVRICGTAGRIEWLSTLNNSASKGGKARAAKAKRVAGRFTSQAAGDDSSALVVVVAPALAHTTTTTVDAFANELRANGVEVPVGAHGQLEQFLPWTGENMRELVETLEARGKKGERLNLNYLRPLLRDIKAGRKSTPPPVRGRPPPNPNAVGYHPGSKEHKDGWQEL